MEHRRKKLLNQAREAICLKHYSIRTEASYITWIKRYIFFHNKRHPSELGSATIEAFLTPWAVAHHGAASPQNQALSAWRWLDRDVRKASLDRPIDAMRAKKPPRGPTVLTTEDTLNVLEPLSGTPRLMAKRLSGGGLRRMAGLCLRIQALDVAPRQIIVRDGNGLQERVTMRPECLLIPLQEYWAHVRRIHAPDVAPGVGPVSGPVALERQYPHAGRLWIGPSVFPSDRVSKDPRTGIIRRHHASASALQKAVGIAGRSVGLNTRVSCQTCRHSVATHLLQQGYDIRTVQERLGHQDVKTTMVSTHVLNRGRLAVRSPLD